MSRQFRKCVAKGDKWCFVLCACKLRSLPPIAYGNKWFKFASSILNITLFFKHIILLTNCILSPSTVFRRPKHAQNCPAPNFRPIDVCSPMYTGLFTFDGPSQYLSSFPNNRPKSKKNPFLTDFLVHPQKKSMGLVYDWFRCHQPST